MTVIWMNDEATEAVLRRGLLRHRYAAVHRDPDSRWMYSASGGYVEVHVSDGLRVEVIERRRRALDSHVWVSADRVKIPKARLLERKRGGV